MNLPTFDKMKLLFAAVLLFPLLVAGKLPEDPIVQAILFYSPSCPHCHQVIDELLIPMQEQYGDQLQIVGIDTSRKVGGELYEKSIELLSIPSSRLGVPTLIIGDTVLVGSAEIPDRFPALVEAGLLAGGVGWPDIPDLAVAIPDLPPNAGPGAKPETITPALSDSEGVPDDQKPTSVPTAVPTADNPLAAAVESTDSPPNSVPQEVQPVQSLENVSREGLISENEIRPADPVGFVLAWLVLLGTIAALIYAIREISISRPWKSQTTASPIASSLTWIVPLLALLGLGVALYLSYVEVLQVDAVCGPVGECNIVQASPYARLFGIPIAVLGVLSYITIIALWFGQRFIPKQSAIFLLGLVIITIIGAGFSAYLTVLELFFIEAVCAWCLTSAVISTLIMLLVARAVTTRPSRMKLEVQS